jgi:hypothetical protein
MKSLKIAVFYLTLICSAFFASAATTIPIDIDVKLDFEPAGSSFATIYNNSAGGGNGNSLVTLNSNNFRLVLPGFERMIYLGERLSQNQSHSDEIVDGYTYYYELDEEKYCTNAAARIGEYKNVTEGLTSMLNSCRTMVDQLNTVNNRTDQYINERDSCVDSKASIQQERDIYFEKWTALKNSSGVCSQDYDQCKSERDEYQKSASALPSVQSSLSTCSSSLDSEKKGKTTYAIIGLAAGVFVTYMFLKRKSDREGPSEQMDVGQVSDYSAIPQAPRRQEGFPEFAEKPR